MFLLVVASDGNLGSSLRLDGSCLRRLFRSKPGGDHDYDRIDEITADLAGNVYLLGVAYDQGSWPGDYLAKLGGPAACDFDLDVDCDLDDVNAMLGIGPIADGVPASGNEAFDLNGDMVVNAMDLGEWLEMAALDNGFASPYKRGDANLDGIVDGLDFIAWNAHKFTTALQWDHGDFNADGNVDGLDFILWNGNKFTASDFVSIPEPSALVLLLLALSLAGCTRGRGDLSHFSRGKC